MVEVFHKVFLTGLATLRKESSGLFLVRIRQIQAVVKTPGNFSKSWTTLICSPVPNGTNIGNVG